MTLAAGVEAGTLLAEPHHDGSDLYVLEEPAEVGDDAVVRLRVPHEAAADRVFLRYTYDGQPRTVEATVDQSSAGETWWRARFPARNPTTRYRWLLTGGELGYAWLTGLGLVGHETHSRAKYHILVVLHEHLELLCICHRLVETLRSLFYP